MSKLVFTKEYTRDYSLIIEQAWTMALRKSPLGNTNPHHSVIVDYINDGVTEVWENQAAIKWYLDELHQKNQEDPDFFHTTMDEYEKILSDLKNTWENKFTKSFDDLINFVDFIFNAMNYFLIFYYSAFDNRAIKEILDRANRLRDEDEFFEGADNYIRESIQKIYPQIGKLSVVISRKELHDIPDIKILEARYKNYVADIDSYYEVISLENFIKQHKDYQFIVDEIKDHNKVSGQIAFKGKVRGKVRIIKRKDQVSEFQEGEILVSPMTIPDFLPAMKKASAFVTDEGGIVCHAAILARELKIPCVIGTKVATQVFKDGDMVEVDAEHGIVKKIK